MIGMSAPPETFRAPTPQPHPWWSYLTVGLLVAGSLVAFRVLSRQSTHIFEDRAAARQVRAIAGRVEEVEAEVHYLRDFVHRVEADAAAKSRANARRIEQVQEQATGRADAGDARDDARDDAKPKVPKILHGDPDAKDAPGGILRK